LNSSCVSDHQVTGLSLSRSILAEFLVIEKGKIFMFYFKTLIISQKQIIQVILASFPADHLAIFILNDLAVGNTFLIIPVMYFIRIIRGFLFGYNKKTNQNKQKCKINAFWG